MMLVVAPAEDQQTKTMLSEDKEENCLRGNPSMEGSSQDDTDAPMSSSEADHHNRGERTGGRRSKPSSSSKRQKSRSPSRQSKPSSSSRVKVRGGGGVPSHSRSAVDNEDKGSRSRSSRRYSESAGAAPQTGEEEGSQRSKPSSSSHKTGSTAKSSTASSRRGRSTTSTTNSKYSESKGDREAARNRRRNSTEYHPSEGKEGGAQSFTRSQTTSGVPAKRGENKQQMSSTGSLPRNNESTSNRRHRSKSRSRSTKPNPEHDTERSARSVKSERSDVARGVLVKAAPQQESTLDSTGPNATRAPTTASTVPPSTAPNSKPDTGAHLSLRSSVKVTSALVKFRKVLAMSKEASASAQKYRVDQEKQIGDKGMENLGNIDTTSSHKENSRSGKRVGTSSHHRREGDSRHSKHRTSSHHRRKSDHGDNSSNRTKRKTKARSPSPRRAGQPTSGRKQQDAAMPDAMVNADTFLKEALSDVGRRLSRASKKEVEDKKEAEDKKKEAAAPSASAPSDEEPASAVRLKSSAKVSTAVLKFQQALALSRSATQAAKTTQDTQNKLLGEVHADKTTEDYQARASYHSKFASTMAVSPVSALDVVDPTEEIDSPKVPSDLDGDSDIDSEIEIDDVNEDDDTISDVATDSEDEKEDDGLDASDMDVDTPAIIPTVVSTTDSDFDMDSDVDDHSDVDIDSDDDLDSDEELETSAKSMNTDTDVQDDNNVDDGSGSDRKSSASGAPMDSDDELDSDCDAAERQETGAVLSEMPTPDPPGDLSAVQAMDALVREDQTGSSDVEKLLKETTKDSSKADTTNSDTGEKGDMANRNVVARSLSFNDSLSGSQSLLEHSLTWNSTRDLRAPNKVSNLVGPVLNRADESKSSIMTEEDSQPTLSYLPTSMKQAEREDEDFNDDHLVPKPMISNPEKTPSSSGRRSSASSSSDAETKPSRKDPPSRKSSNVRKSKSFDQPLDVEVARKLLNDDSLGRRGKSSSRMRKPPSRSRSSVSTSAKSEAGGSQRERRSKPSSSSSGDRDKTRSSDRSKGSERERSRRASSASRSRTLNGLSSFSSKASSYSSDKQEDGRKPSSRKRTPGRAKSHDVRSSRHGASSRNPDRDARERSRSRKSSAPALEK